MSHIENAVRKGYRYKSPVGVLTTEDLFQLPLTSKTGASLDGLARSVNNEIKAAGEESFVSTGTSPALMELKAKLEVIKVVIAYKEAENEAKRDAKAAESQRAVILEAISKRKQSDLEGKSLAELEAELAKLG